MIDQKNTRQSLSYKRPQRATINISGVPEDDDDELLEMMYQSIKNERDRVHRMQNGNFVDFSNDSPY